MLKFRGNPAAERVKPYKKSIMMAVKTLTMLDDMSVSDVERMRVEKQRDDGFEAEVVEDSLIKQLDSKGW